MDDWMPKLLEDGASNVTFTFFKVDCIHWGADPAVLIGFTSA
jgi:hypothetical protein